MNLAIGDFLMGVYLLIIAAADMHYRGSYILYDVLWRTGAVCKFAGFLSTYSSELSVLTLTVITLDRFNSIIFPFRIKRLGMRGVRIVMATVWALVFAIAVLPLTRIDYFDNFYGRSGVCLALHITPDKPSGWEYSVSIFLVLNFLAFLTIFGSYIWMFIVARRTTAAASRTPQMKTERAMARRMTLIVMTDFCCWVPIILLGAASLGGANIPSQVTTVVGGAKFSSQVTTVVGGANIPPQVATVVGRANIPSQVTTVVGGANIPSQLTALVGRATFHHR